MDFDLGLARLKQAVILIRDFIIGSMLVKMFGTKRMFGMENRLFPKF